MLESGLECGEPALKASPRLVFWQDWPRVMWPEEEDQSVQRLWEHDALGHQPPHRVGRVSFFSSKSKYSIEYCLGYCLTLLGFTKQFLKILSHVKSPLGQYWNKIKQYAPRSTVKHRMIEKCPTQILDFQSLGKGKKYSCLSNFCFDICVNDNDKFNCLKSVWFEEKKKTIINLPKWSIVQTPPCLDEIPE